MSYNSFTFWKALGKEPQKINSLLFIGDSLSDRGTIYKRKLFGFLRLKSVSGLDKSPKGRFTNGYCWSDFVCNWFIQDFIIKNALKKGMRSDDIGDAVIAHHKGFYEDYMTQYHLWDNQKVSFAQRKVLRTYTEGGLTAQSYGKKPTLNPKLNITRLIVSSLKSKRSEIKHDDRRNNISSEQKAKTLVMELSGANDLIVVNHHPKFRHVDAAVKYRIRNIEWLINQGYRQFILFNLPDLALSPRFKAKSQPKQTYMSNLCKYFNQSFAANIEVLRAKHPACNIQLFNLYAYFQNFQEHPEIHGFRSECIDKPFIESEDFSLIEKDNGEKISPGKGYLFWDDLHPSAQMHSIIGASVFEEVKKLVALPRQFD